MLLNALLSCLVVFFQLATHSAGTKIYFTFPHLSVCLSGRTSHMRQVTSFHHYNCYSHERSGSHWRFIGPLGIGTSS